MVTKYRQGDENPTAAALSLLFSAKYRVEVLGSLCGSYFGSNIISEIF